MNAAQQAQYMQSVRELTSVPAAERFQLVLRHEKREQTAYVLTVAKSGPKMKDRPPE